MRCLTVHEGLVIHSRIMGRSSGAMGILTLAGLESALAQPRTTFGGRDLYPTIVEKAAALGFSLIRNHPFLDGNKRTGHATMETFLVLNGIEISATEDEQFSVILRIASGDMNRDDFTEWLEGNVTTCKH